MILVENRRKVLTWNGKSQAFTFHGDVGPSASVTWLHLALIRYLLEIYGSSAAPGARV